MRQRKSLWSLVGLAVLCLCQTAAAQERPVAILHARMIDGLGGAPVEDAAVILQGSKITYAGPANGAKVPQGAQVIDAKGKTVMPGLADMHVHLTGGWDGIGTDLLG